MLLAIVRRGAVIGGKHSLKLLSVVVFSLVTQFCAAQDADFSSLSDEEQKQVKIAERFLTVLERSPRRGTALDRVYGHHVEFGSLDKFLGDLRKRVEDKPKDGVGWMLLGMFEAQRGEDANAVDAFRKAEEHRAEDALASYYLGQSLLLIGQPEEAVLAFERATQRKPRRADMLEIFRQLGRVHQRAQRTEDAMKVWDRLESLFPDDPRVQEQIAATLSEEGQYKLALPRYEKLAEMVRDDYRRVVFKIEAAELKIRDGQKKEGLADFEELLANLNPTGWLHRDVRRRIEEVYLRSGDQDGLVTYYQGWLENNKEDVGAMARLAKFLASAARIPEATKWMERALKLAPSRTDLRKSFIDQLVDDQRYAEASKQYEELVKSAQGNQDFLRDWGRLVMRDKSVELDQRKQNAAQIWNQILTTRPDDALTHAQVADLFRQSNIEDKAIELYKRAIELSPADPQYREYLGEYYHILKRPEDAQATWKEIAAGDRRNATNVARLAEVYNSFGYLEQAVTEIAAACKLDSKDFALLIKASEYHSRAAKHDEALEFVDQAGQLAANDEERGATLNQRIEVFQASRRLEEETAKLAESLNDASTEDEWLTLARYYEADRRWPDATDAIAKALEKAPKSVLALGTSARIAEMSGDYTAAADLNRKLAEVDRRSRSDHLMNVARLEAQLGRTEQALQAGKDLIVSAPGNTDNYEFYAQLCFQLGQMQEGLDALRKAVRINPTEPALIMSLGSALSREFRTDEAIEVYWRAFEKTDEIDDKTSLTQKLAELYLQLNQFDKLLERFERDRREDSKRREMTICLAQAHNSAGDYGIARRELESLLSENTRDTNLLQQISKLCEQEADLDGAIEYQKQLASIAPGHETEYRLAGLLQRRGDDDEASAIFVRLTQREENPVRLLRSIDSLLRQSSYESVIAVTEPLLSESRDDWELLYREAVAWASMDKIAEAKDRLQRLLALNIPHDKLGRSAEEKFKRNQARARSNNLRGIQTTMPTKQSPLQFLARAYEIRRAIGLDSDNYYVAPGSRPTVWAPDVYGRARMAALAWLMKFEDRPSTEDDGKEDKADAPDAEAPSIVDTLAKKANDEDAHRNDIYDYMYVQQLKNNLDEVFKMGRRLAKDGGKEEKRYFLTSLNTRHVNSQTQQGRARSANEKPAKKPLSEDDLALMMECYEALSAESSKDAALTSGGQILVSGGRTYIMINGSYRLLDGMSSFNVGIVSEELRVAGRIEEADKLVDEAIAKASSSSQLIAAMQLRTKQEDTEGVDELFDRWVTAAQEEIAKSATTSGSTSNRRSSRSSAAASPVSTASGYLTAWMGQLGAEEENEKVLDILNRTLNVAVDEGKLRRSKRSRRRSRSRSTRQQVGSNFQVYYGKKNTYTRLNYPSPNEYINQAGIWLLRQAYEVVNRNEVPADLTTLLKKRVAAAEDSGDALYEQLMLGYVLWWMEEKDEAVKMITTAASQLPDDPSFRLETARLHQLLGDPDSALEVVESIAPRDQKLVQQKELLALQLAERLGDVDRARSAAERLFGLRLDTNTQLQLVDQMRRLGMMEMGEAIMARAQRRSGSQTKALPRLMTLYQGQGKTELAQQIAHKILRRTKSPLALMSTSSRNPFRSSRSNNAERTQALRLLQQTGALKELVARAERQLERSPESTRLYEQLIEYYQTSNERKKVGEMLTKGVENKPDSIAMRYQLAKHYEQTGKTSEACDQYLEVLKRKPSWVADDLYQVRRSFERANRSLDLVNAFSNVNLKSVGSPYYLVDLVENMLRRGSNSSDEEKEIAIDFFERVFEAYPSYRNNMISSLYDEELWKNPRIFALGKRGIIPSESQVSSSPWAGVDQIYSWSNGGTVNSMFHRVSNAIKGTEKADELRKAIEDGLERSPDWYGGEAMLALVELKNKERDKGKKRLEELLADESRIKTMPVDTGWILGQELDKFEDTRDLAEKLFEHSASNNNRDNQSLTYSPIVRLVDLYQKSGRKNEARKLLVKATKQRNNDGYNDDYYNSIRLGNSVISGEKLLKLGYPVDAVKLFREVLDTPKATLESATRYGYADNAGSRAQKGLESAIKALSDSNADETINELLAVKEAKKGKAAIDLMIKVPTVSGLQTEKMESQLMMLLDTIAASDKVSESVARRLDSLSSEKPDDVSIAITHSLFALAKNLDTKSKSLKVLEEALSKNPLDEIAEGRRPNSRQRRQAQQHLPLWLVARECLDSEEHRELGTKLAEQAVVAARRQVDQNNVVAILYDWGKRAVDAGDRETAEVKWSELLDVVTRRPTSRKKPAAGQRGLPRPTAIPPRRTGSLPKKRSGLFSSLHGGVGTILLGQVDAPAPTPQTRRPQQPLTASSGRRTPPLTISQFRTTIEIALVAARNEMPALSQRAIKESLKGGLPVPDPTTQPTNMGPRIVRTSSSRTPGVNANEVEVATSLRNVLGIWESKDGYDPAAVYGLLHPLVIPKSRPAEIMMYADSSQLSNLKSRSLGVSLVKWAAKAKQLDDLTRRVNDRKKQPTAEVPALVLLSHIAMADEKSDAAKERLDELDAAIRKRPLQPMIQLACHAAIPATERESLQAEAYRILNFSLQQQNANADANQNSQTTIGPMVQKVMRYLAKTGDQKSVREYYDSYLVGRQSHYSRYSGDYGNYVQQRDIANLAGEAAKTGSLELALDFLGRSTDVELTRYSRPSLKLPMAAITKKLSALPADERFAVWHQWTMPQEGRQTIRFIGEYSQAVETPEVFLNEAAKNWKNDNKTFLCNFIELAQAAKGSGKLKQLIDEARAAKKEKIAHADTLLTLLLVYDDQIDKAQPLVQRLLKTIDDRLKSENNSRPSFLPDYAIYKTCMEHSAQAAELYGDSLVKMRETARTHGKHETVRRIPLDYARRYASKNKFDWKTLGQHGLKHWQSVFTFGREHAGYQPWWAVQDNKIIHISGGTYKDMLYFAYPITGDFVFEADCFEGNWAESDLGYGGVIVESQAYGSRMRINSLAEHETVYRAKPYVRNRERFGTVKIESRDGKFTYSLNNNIVHEEETGETSPWLVFFTEGARLTSIRNLRLSGNPTVPEKINLIAGDSMDGWNTSFFGENQPRKRLLAEPTTDDRNDYNARYQQREPTEYDWLAKKGVLTAESKTDADKEAESWAYYHRPLADNETFRYEFFHKAGREVAHPTIGRLALLLYEDGVKSHWITSRSFDETVLELPFDNQIAEEAYQRTQELKLKEDDWNQVELRLADAKLVVSLNGDAIFERPVSDLEDTRFGFYRMQSQRLKVRNATLTGDWPKSLDEIKSDLLAVNNPARPAIQRLVSKVTNDKFVLEDIPSVVKTAVEMEDQAAYDFLKGWVLPTESHDSFRLSSQLKPRDSTSSTGGRLSPIIELLNRAEKAGKLDELASEIKDATEAATVSDSAKEALQSLIAMRQGDFEQAKQILSPFYKRMNEKQTWLQDREQRRHALLVAEQASLYPDLQLAADDICAKIRGKEHGKGTGNDFRNQVRIAGGIVEQRLAGSPSTTLSQWHSVIYDKPSTRAKGLGPSSWQSHRGALLHHPGGTWTQLFFQSPLRGNFKIVTEQSTHGYQEVHTAYGMYSAEPYYDQSGVKVTKLMHNSTKKSGKLDIPGWNDRLSDFRIEVDGDKIATFTNNLKIHEQQFKAAPDPWIVLQADEPGLRCMINNLRIIGEPEIPDEIRLLETDGLAGWRADIYSESIDSTGNSETAPWTLSGEELMGRELTTKTGRFRESLMAYQRPMLEDGQIEFEAFYVPGEVEVHPAIGQFAFMLRDDGVHLHRLTDAEWDLDAKWATNNEERMSDDPIELKKDDWNHYMLTVEGNKLTISVNNEPVVEYELAQPPSQRFFGLFRYSDQTTCRVRNVVYRGDWPKQLPPIAEQELAYPKGGPLLASNIANKVEFDLTRSLDELSAEGIERLGDENQVTASDSGLQVTLKKDQPDWPGIKLNRELTDDFEVTVDFRDLKMKGPKDGWGVCFALHVMNKEKLMAEVSMGREIDSEVFVKMTRQYPRVDDGMATDTNKRSIDFDSGRLKLVRDGGCIHCLVAPKGKDFRLLRSYAVGQSPTTEIVVQNKCSDKAGEIDVVLSKMTLITKKKSSPDSVSAIENRVNTSSVETIR